MISRKTARVAAALATFILLAAILSYLTLKQQVLDNLEEFSKEFVVPLLETAEDPLSPRSELLKRPVRFLTWQIPKDIYDEFDRLDGAGHLDLSDTDWGMEFDTIVIGLNGWDDVENWPLQNAIPLNFEDTKDNRPETQLIVGTLSRNKDGKPFPDLTVIQLNLAATSTLPKVCEAHLIFEALVYLRAASDLLRWAHHSSVPECIRNQKAP